MLKSDTKTKEFLRELRQREVQALHAGLSRRDWHATEKAANELRDKIDNYLIRGLYFGWPHKEKVK